MLTLVSQRELHNVAGIPETVSPFAKVQSISAVYFPQFVTMVQQLDTVASAYIAWIYVTAQKKFSKTIGDEPLGFEEAYGPYVTEREALLDALSEFARKEFQ